MFFFHTCAVYCIKKKVKYGDTFPLEGKKK